jgi:hypothetical protein
MAKEEPQHKDILGQPLKEGNYVAACRRNTMVVCTIKKMAPIQMRIVAINSKKEWLVYPYDTVLLDSPDALVYILKTV